MNYFMEIRNKIGNTPVIINGSAGAILKNEKILLVFHKNKQKWQIPGGIQEYGESLERTIERELFEELSIELSVDKLVYVQSDPKYVLKYGDGFEFQSVTVLYLMKGNYDEESIKVQKEEIEEYRYFKLNDIPSNTFECCKEKIDKLKEYLKN